MSAEQNRQLYLDMKEKLVNTGDESKFGEYFSPDLIEHFDLPPGWPKGLEGVKLFVRELHTAFPDFKATVEHVLGDGEMFAGRIRCTGTHLGSFMGIPATGKKLEWTESHFGRIKNGKLAEHWGDADRLGMMTQMGVIPTPDEAHARAATTKAKA